MKEIKKIASNIKPTFSIGKNGITENFIEQIDNYLEKHNIVKIKVLSKDKLDVIEISDTLSEELDAEIIDRKGFTFVLFRK